jgi:hypothetical protein
MVTPMLAVMKARLHLCSAHVVVGPEDLPHRKILQPARHGGCLEPGAKSPRSVKETES